MKTIKSQQVQDVEQSYYFDLSNWVLKLKKKAQFKNDQEDFIKLASNLNPTYKDYDELELYATYLMLSNQFYCINDNNKLIEMAIEFLEDESSEMKASSKLLVYFYQIVKGEL